jgi:synaptobrevin homolog YKT6
VASFRNSDTPVPFPELQGYIKNYQNPEAADSIMKIQNELLKTKIVMHSTIESVLWRGEQIEKLAYQSKDLSVATKLFATRAKKENSCWLVYKITLHYCLVNLTLF